MVWLLCLAPSFAVTLEEAWAAAERDNDELALLSEQQVQADALRHQAWAYISPQLSLTSNYIFNDHATEVDFGAMFAIDLPDEYAFAQPMIDEFGNMPPLVLEEKRYLTWEAQVVQPLISGQAVPGLLAARRTADATDADTDGGRSQLRQAIAQVYYGVVVAREGVALAEDARSSAIKHKEMADALVAAGTAPPNARLQAEIAVSRAERDLARAREQRRTAEEAFARLTELPRDSAVEMPPTPEIPWSDPEMVIEEALRERPEVRAALLRQDAASAARTATNLGWLPSVNLVGKYSFSESTGFTDEKTRWRVILNAQWTLWDGGIRVAEQQKMASMSRSATIYVEKTQDETREQVRVAWDTWTEAQIALTAVEQELRLAEENQRLAETAFAAGSASFLDVEDARLGVAAARLALLSERMRRDLAALKLRSLAGR